VLPGAIARRSDDDLEGGSFRPYGARGFFWGAFPGLRYAPSGAIFASSLREEKPDLTRPLRENEVVPSTKFPQAIVPGCRPLLPGRLDGPEKPEIEQRKEHGADGELEPDGRMRWREEAFQAAGDDEHGDDAGDQARGFETAAGDGVFPAQRAGKEHGVAEAEACAAGNEDGRQLERAVSGDEAPQENRHAVLMAGGADDAEHHAIEEEIVEGAQAEGDSSRKSDEAYGEVVGHDVAGFHGGDADDGLGPHLMALHGGDHLGTDEVAHEFRARTGEHGAENAEGHGDNYRREDEADLTLEYGWILVAQKQEQSAQIRLAAGINDMVSPSQQLIYMHRIGAGGGVLAQDGEVSRYLAIEQGHLLQLGAGKLAEAAGVGLGEERSQPIPVGPALRDPLVGEDLSHGRWWGPEF
jgi:hypothetical protein